MENINNIDLIIGLVNQFPKDLTEKSKLNKLNEELEKKGKRTIGKTTFYKIKRQYPDLFISNKEAEKKAKQKPRSDYKLIREECIKVLSQREKILIDETKSYVEQVVEEKGSSSKRRRTRIMFNYVIDQILDGSDMDHLLIGLKMTQNKDDILRLDGKEAKPTIKALNNNELNKYDQKLCKINDLKWLKTNSGNHENPAQIVFMFIEGRFQNFKGKLDRDSLRINMKNFNDPRTLLSDEERFQWLKKELEKNECKLLDKEWKGSRKKVAYLCPKKHFNDPLLTNYFQSTNKYSCPECNEGGFDPGKPAWFYLMEKEEEQQFGITNHKERRIGYHKKNNWKEIAVTVSSHPGKEVQELEKTLKVWLKTEVGLLPHRTERWDKNKRNIRSLKQLKEESGVETSIF